MPEETTLTEKTHIRCKVIIEVLGKPKEHVEKALRTYVEKINNDSDLIILKKEFADATGIDISGKVDKSHALMTFGLALMQNKAGKGFNVGKMLSAVGKAGETALPALEKAREKLVLVQQRLVSML